MDNEALAKTIKVLRTERDMSRKDLAEAAGLSYPYLAEIENGRKPASRRALEAIAAGLDVRPHELMADAEHRSTPRSDWFGSPTNSMASAPLMSEEPVSSGRSGPRDELHALIDDLRPDDVRLLLSLARRLAGG